MVEKILAKDRYFNDFGWLKTYWLFSFSDYYDPKNVNHGTLRVFNDDVVQPGKGFGLHPHEEMEIVSIILEGEMTHRDTMGNDTVIRVGDVQRMTAGTGLQHSEWNNGAEAVAFFQIWIQPGQRGLDPSYDQRSFKPEHWQGKLALLASPGGRNGSVNLNADAQLYRGRYESDADFKYQAEAGRALFLYVIEGSIEVNGVEAKTRDQLRFESESELAISVNQSADIILIDVPLR